MNFLSEDQKIALDKSGVKIHASTSACFALGQFFKTGECRGGGYTGSGRFSKAIDFRDHVRGALKALGCEFVEGNDSKSGTAAGGWYFKRA